MHDAVEAVLHKRHFHGKSAGAVRFDGLFSIIPHQPDAVAVIRLSPQLIGNLQQHRSGGSAIVGTIAAPLIFELPFDLIVMWQTFPPSPPTLYTPLYFFPLFLVEILSFALLTLSPVMRPSKSTFFLLAGMFFIFAVWALAGFAYPSTPFPIAMNMLSKVVAFAVAISLFLRDREKLVLPARPREVSREQREQSSEAVPKARIR